MSTFKKLIFLKQLNILDQMPKQTYPISSILLLTSLCHGLIIFIIKTPCSNLIFQRKNARFITVVFGGKINRPYLCEVMTLTYPQTA